MSELDPRLQKHLRALRDVPPRDPQRAAEGRAQFLRMAEEMKPQESSHQAVSFGLFWRLKEWIQPKPQTRKEGLKMANLVIALLMAVSVVFGGGAAAAYASQDALPGDLLYPVKTAVEQAEIALTTDAQTQAELHLELAQERAAEIQALAAEGRLDLIPEIAADMQQHLQQAEQLAQQLAQEGQEEAVARIMVMSQVTEEMLQRAMNQAPPEAQQALAYAAQMAEQAHTQAQHQAAEAQAQAEQMVQEASDTAMHLQEQTQEQAQEHAQNQMREYQPFNLRGQVESMDGETWVVSGQTIIVPEDAFIAGDVNVGDTVQIHGYIDPEGNTVAVQIFYPVDVDEFPEAIPVRFSGIVESMADDAWIISGQQVNITEATLIEGDIALGDIVMVKAQILPDGNLVASHIKLIEGTFHPRPQVISFQGTVESQTDNTWVVAGQTIAIDETTKIHDNPQVGDQVLVVAEVQDDNTLLAKVIHLIAPHNGHSDDQTPPIIPTPMPTQDWDNVWENPTEIPGSHPDGENHPTEVPGIHPSPEPTEMPDWWDNATDIPEVYPSPEPTETSGWWNPPTSTPESNHDHNDGHH